MPVRRHPKLYGYGLPLVMMLTIAAMVVIQVEVANSNRDFNERLCKGSNAARVELNHQGDAIAVFLHEAIKISAQAQRLQQGTTAQPPALKKLRAEYAMALSKLFTDLHPVTLTSCEGA